MPVDPVTPVLQPQKLVVERECCGNILLEGNQPGFLIWESDVQSNVTVTQISVYCDSSSTDSLQLEIDGEEKRNMYVPVGNTANFIGQGVHTISISSKGNTTMSLVEGKYVITTTLQLKENNHLGNENKNGGSSLE
ncbi:S-Ena type endospore appendage [Cohnella sp. WQ 127256]|uniref:S-Ena type endospore appendage n=1 Tax=Cohnella sp. WQ 127256 TaxID=2938790 RepID=UPI002118F8B8|nr:S-Ena type endospore appendage [Cohnella sp. WQ 127256]